MSEKSFGVKQLNILGSSGNPPQIESAENLRIRVGIGSTVIIGDSDTDFNSPSPSFVDPNNTAVLNVGIVTANNYYGGDYYGTFKGTIDSEVSITNAKNIEITDNTIVSGVHYIHFGDGNSGFDNVQVDSDALVYKDKKFGVGTNDPDKLLHLSDAINPFIRLETATTSEKRLDLYVGTSGIGTIQSNQSASQLSFVTTDGEAIRINSSGDVGIGTNDPVGVHSLTNNDSGLTAGYVVANYFYGDGSGLSEVPSSTTATQANSLKLTNVEAGSNTNYIWFGSGDTVDTYDSLKINKNGLVYKDSKLGLGSNDPSCKLTIATDDTTNPILATRYNADTGGATIFLQHSRSDTIGTKVALNDNDVVGDIEFRSYASDNDTIVRTARIFAEADGTADETDVPAALVFATNNKSGAGTAQERLRINSDGIVTLKGTDTTDALDLEINTSSNASTLVLGRNGHITSNIRASDGNSNIGDEDNAGGSRIRLGKNQIHFETYPAEATLGYTPVFAERLSISNTGTVTITKGSGDGLVLKPAADTDTFQINFNKVEDDSTSGAISYDFNTEYLNFRSGGTDRLTLDNNGNLLPDAGSTDGTDGYTLGGTGNYWKAVYAKKFIGANLEANASSATKLQNIRTFQISGNDATAEAQNFDGSQNVDLSLVLATTGVTAGTYGDATNIGQFTVDGKGRITSAVDVPIDISALNAAGADSVKITANSSVNEVKYLWMGDDSSVDSYDELEVDTNLVYDSGNLAIGAVSAGAEGEKYRLYVDGGTLGDVAGDAVNIAQFMNSSSNDDRLQVRGIRTTAGSNWHGSRLRIGRMVDSTPMGYIDFGSGKDTDEIDGNSRGLDIVFGHGWDDSGTWKYKDGLIIKKSLDKNKVDFIPGYDATGPDDELGQDLGSDSAHFRQLFVKKLIGVTVEGSISQADKLSSTRTFQISGDDATAEAQNFDGTQDVNLPLVLANTDVTAGTYGDATNVGQFTVDAKGRITAAVDVPIDISGKESLSATKLNPGALIELSGDVTTEHTDKFTGESTYTMSTTLATLNPDPAGTYGSATVVPKITVNSKGLVTGVVDTTISIDISGDKAGSAGVLDPGASINLTTGDYTVDGSYSGVDFGSPGTTAFTGLSDYTISGALNATGVSAAQYGSATAVPVFKVDSKGRITSVVNQSINFPTVGTVDNAKFLLTGACAETDETNYPIPFATDDSAGGATVYKGYQISNVNNLNFNCKKQQLYCPKMKGTSADFISVKSGLLQSITGDSGDLGQVPVSGGQTVDEDGNITYGAWSWAEASSVGGVTNVTVSQTDRDENLTQPITVSTPETNTKQIDIANSSNAYGRRWIRDTQPDIFDCNAGDIWYDTSDSGDNPVISFVKNMVIMWYGRIDAIPTGWQLCNGSNGSPNLINKFVIGAGVETQVKPNSDIQDINGNSRIEGGWRDAIVVSHWHGGVTHAVGGDGEHSHSGGGHEHNYSKLSNFWSKGGDATNRSAPVTANDVATSGGGDHSHSGGEHVHGIDSEGVEGTYRNLPPWFALCYIMKL